MRGRNAAGFGPAATSTEITAPLPTSLGHQADHQVKFTYSVSNVANEIISASATSMAPVWNMAMEPLKKEIQICMDCEDDYIVTVMQVNNNNADFDATPGPDGNCGKSIACVSIRHVGDPDEAGKHLGNLYLKMEEPPIWTSRDNGDFIERHVMWTATSTIHGDLANADEIVGIEPCDPDIPTPIYYQWIDPVMLHEFGHTLGLHDFYNDPDYRVKKLKAIMTFNTDHITREDIAQLRAIYIRHVKH